MVKIREEFLFGTQEVRDGRLLFLQEGTEVTENGVF
jgi:hypothetical protein